MVKSVLHVVPYMDPSAGGPSVVVERLVLTARENGYAATVLTTEEMTKDEGRSIRARHPNAVTLPSQIAAFGVSGNRRVKEAVGSADIIHLHTMWSPLVGWAARQATRSDIPYILSPHGMLDPYSLAQKTLKKKIYLGLIERSTLRNAAQILFTADEERRLAEPVTAKLPCAIIALGADRPPAPRQALRMAFLKNHPDLEQRKCVIFLGRLHHKKRPLSVIRALAKIRHREPDVCLLVAGSGPVEAEMRALCSSLDVVDAVRFLGFVQGQEKWEALSAADLFLLPSKQENFAIALAEALSAGVPAFITPQVNTWREVIEAGAGALIDTHRLDESLADLCLGMLNSPEKLAAASKAAQELAARAFDWNIAGQKTHALYDQVICNLLSN